MVSAVVRHRNGTSSVDISGSGAGPFADTCDSEPLRATYGAFASITMAATPTDVLTIQGSASKLIRLKSIVISGSASAPTNVVVSLIRRSAANTGGTSAPVTPGKHDSNDNAVTATVLQWTANPAGLGTQVAIIHGARLNLAPAANGSIDRVFFQYAWMNDKALVLSGASDFLALNLAGVAVPATSIIDIDIEWTEE